MRPALALGLCCAASLALVAGCGRKPAPPPPAPTTAWTAGDTQHLSDTLMPLALNAGWAGLLRDRNGRPPALRLGQLDDRSDDHVPTVAIAGAMAEAVRGSSRVTLAPAEGGDAVLSGIIRVDRRSTPPTWSVDLRIDDPTGDKLWSEQLDWAVGSR
jgi:hypothetical protein